MFYSQFILAKKGPLGTIWIAAHLERKLRKNQVADTDIGFSVDSILFPEVPIALRLSSHLLLGVVRIYSRKVGYLFDDCSEALLKVKQAFRSTTVDLAPEESTAPYHSITLPETFDLDDFELPDNEIFQGNYVDHHVSARERITLQDTMDGVVYSTSQFGLDERFGDGDASQIKLDLDEEVFQGDAAAKNEVVSGADQDASVDATTALVKDATATGASEAMLVDRSEDQVEGLAVHTEFNEYAQAPQTPGLVEVPNLSGVQEELACEDHMEVEEHNISESVPTEELRNASTKLNLHDSSTCMASDLEKQNKLGGELSVSFVAGKNSLLARTTSAHNELEKTGQAHVESPCCSHITTELEEPGLELNVPETGNDDDMTDKLIPLASEAPLPLDSCGRPEVVDTEHLACQEPKDPGASTEIQGDELDSALHGQGHTGGRLSDEQPHNLLASDNQLENLTGSVSSDFPAPEKLLSVPKGVADKHKDFLIEYTPDKEELSAAKGDAGTKNISGKKRTFTESTLTAESLNSVESVGLICFKRTADSIPDDDDLLSSILVGKSSFLKMKPTPVLEVASKKRLRSAPRSTTSKRKGLLDDLMVLHGDTIRQQLINTEGIRRVRKKAPCTRPEILMIHRQLLEDQLFTEPVVTGMSVELVSLHREPYDLKGIRIVKSDEYHTSTGPAKDPECSARPDALERHTAGGSSAVLVPRNDVQEQPAEIRMHQQDQQSKGHDTPGQTKYHSGEDRLQPLQDRLLGENYEIEVDKGETGAAEEMNHSIAHGEICEMPIREKSDIAEDFQLDGSCDNHDEKLDGQVVKNVSIFDTNYKSGRGPMEDLECDVENFVSTMMDLKAEGGLLLDEEKVDASVEVNDAQTDRSGPCDNANGSPIAALLEGDSSSGMAFVNGDDAVREANNDGVQIVQLESDDQNLAWNRVSNEEEPDAGIKSPFPGDRDNPTSEEVDQRRAVVAGIPAQDCFAGGDHGETENAAVEHDTEFLNVDDDEGAEDDDDCVPYGDETLLENSGWSSRTRAVAKYLLTLFDDEAEHGKKVLSVDNLLTGKNRKEASRMFFETLVLKTRDYIHVEQPKPFDSINVKARAKLVNSIF